MLLIDVTKTTAQNARRLEGDVMKKRMTLILVTLTVSFSAFALPVRGRQVQSNLTQNIPSENCGAIDPMTACYASSNNYLQCTAKGSLSQKCQASLTNPLTGQLECASVERAGGCQCDTRTKVTTGSCQYMR
jgi:hypothetical protein